MQGKTSYTILLSIIAVLTLALAVMVIFLFTAFNSSKAEVNNKNKKSAERIVPREEQAELKLYPDKSDGSLGVEVFNIKSTEDYPNSFLVASISIIYDGGKKNKLLEKRKELLEVTCLSKLRQATIEYFLDKTYEQLQATDAIEKAKESLKNTYNSIATDNPEEKIIIDVVFEKWNIQ